LNQSHVLSFRTDYLLHTVLFLPWIVLARFYVYRSPERLMYRIILWITFGLILAIGSEAIQYWLPYRSFNIIDLYFNLLGIALGGLIFLWGRNSEVGDRRSEVRHQHPVTSTITKLAPSDQ
jgi:glycopeptide antibiotics resistance protein